MKCCIDVPSILKYPSKCFYFLRLSYSLSMTKKTNKVVIKKRFCKIFCLIQNFFFCHIVNETKVSLKGGLDWQLLRGYLCTRDKGCSTLRPIAKIFSGKIFAIQRAQVFYHFLLCTHLCFKLF